MSGIVRTSSHQQAGYHGGKCIGGICLKILWEIIVRMRSTIPVSVWGRIFSKRRAILGVGHFDRNNFYLIVFNYDYIKCGFLLAWPTHASPALGHES